MKIIIIDHEPYTSRRGKQFFEEEFIRDGYSFEFWSLSKLLSYSKKLNYVNVENKDNVEYIRSWKELKNKFDEQSALDTYFFIECWFNSHSWTLFYYLKKGGFKWGRLDYYHNPTVNFYSTDKQAKLPNKSNSSVGRIKNFLQNLVDYRYLSFQIMKRINFNFLKNIMKPTAVFQTGSYVDNPSADIDYYSLNYFDIDVFNLEINQKPFLDYKYIVFADIYLGRHPDLKIHSNYNYIDLNQYYSFLDTFFTKIEQITYMPVVIAAHPKSDYTNEFGDRLVVKNKTANLVINSSMFLNHGSLSISFALLARKPIVSFYNNDFLKNNALMNFVTVMNSLADRLDTVTINVDELHDYSIFLNNEVDDVRYEDALKTYFKGNNLNATNYDVVKLGILNYVH